MGEDVPRNIQITFYAHTPAVPFRYCFDALLVFTEATPLDPLVLA